jgi:CDP-6-deoxy-D-xylo-4-hexulose-3-dehydrase
MTYELSSTSWGQEELDAMQRVLRSGRFTMGEQVRLFEDAFADRFGMKHAVMVNSGSSANLVGIATLFYRSKRPLQRGDEVIVPAISWATTFHPLQQYGLRLRFVDVELDTLNMDVSRLEAALTPRTRMVVAVSILGNPAPLDRIRAFCDAHDLILFEDNCESMGASLNGRWCGTFGHINTFSTFYSHHISTMEGGLLVTNDIETDHLARAIRNHGWARDLPHDSVVNRGQALDDPFFEAYRFVVPGYNVRPLELAGAVGQEQIKKLDAMLAIRRQNAAHFVSLFKDDPRFIIQRENGSSSWFSFTMILNPAMNLDRARLMESLRNADIQFRMITGGCFPEHAAVKYFDYDIVGDIANAKIAHERGFFVGNHPRDLTPELNHLRGVLEGVR